MTLLRVQSFPFRSLRRWIDSLPQHLFRPGLACGLPAHSLQGLSDTAKECLCCGKERAFVLGSHTSVRLFSSAPSLGIFSFTPERLLRSFRFSQEVNLAVCLDAPWQVCPFVSTPLLRLGRISCPGSTDTLNRSKELGNCSCDP